jgi:serpin B
MRKRVWTTGLGISLLVTLSAGLLLVAVSTGLLLAREDVEAPRPRHVNDKGATMEGTQQLVDGANQAAFELYGKLAAEPGNLFFSPYSIATALAMVYEGARVDTAKEIAATFHLPEDATARRSGFAALHNALNAPDSAYKLSVANALWVQRDYPLTPEFPRIVEEYYGGGATPVDFAGDTEGARVTINDWVAKRTQDRIKDLFAPRTLDPLTRLVLTNAIYFKGTWTKPFDKRDTLDKDFFTAGGGTVTASLMHLHTPEAKFGYAEADGIQLLELPYEGGKLCMLVLLPKLGELDQLEKLLSPAKLAAWRQALVTQRVNVTLPKFTVDTKYDLNDTLAALGMPSAFKPGVADFTGMEPKRELYIQLVVHQAFVEVNEEGTEAAAATGAAVGMTSAPRPVPVPEFKADHPFLYLIVEKDHGTVLFLGRLQTPEQ